MAETTTGKDPTANVVDGFGSDAEVQDPLKESLDELARIADTLVDELTFDAPEQAPPAETPSPESRHQAMQETLDNLDRLIEDPSPPPIPAETQLSQDLDDDISQRLDALLTTEPQAGAPSVAVDSIDAALSPDSQTTSAAATAPVVEQPVQLPAPAPPARVAAPVAVTPPVVAREVPTDSARTRPRPTLGYLLLAVIAMLVVAGGVFWFLQPPTEVPVAVAEVAMPDPPVVFTKPAYRNPAESIGDGVDAEPVPPADESASLAALADLPDVTAVAPTPATAETTPQIPEPLQIEPVAEPTTAPDVATLAPVAATAEATPQTPEPPKTEPVVEPVFEPAVAPTTTPPVETTLAPADEPGPQAASIGATLIPAPIEMPTPPAPEPVVEAPAVTVAVPPDQPPVVIDRIEPVLNLKSIRRGKTQSVVLRVLVNAEGRVARVVVDESVQGSESEAAAINAVLRWTYQPALACGEPVRRWTTERFEFTRPAN